MRRFVVALLIPCLMLLVSCGAIPQLGATLAQTRGAVNDLNASQAEIKPEVSRVAESVSQLTAAATSLASDMKTMERESLQKADKDGDGNLDMMERIMYLLLLGGGAAEVARRKMKGTQGQIQSLHGRIEHEREKRKVLEQNVATPAQPVGFKS